jgi:hypothetical protein
MGKVSDPLEEMRRFMRAMKPAGDLLHPALAMARERRAALASIGVSALASSMRHQQLTAVSILGIGSFAKSLMRAQQSAISTLGILKEIKSPLQELRGLVSPALVRNYQETLKGVSGLSDVLTLVDAIKLTKQAALAAGVALDGAASSGEAEFDSSEADGFRDLLVAIVQELRTGRRQASDAIRELARAVKAQKDGPLKLCLTTLILPMLAGVLATVLAAPLTAHTNGYVERLWGFQSSSHQEARAVQPSRRPGLDDVRRVTKDRTDVYAAPYKGAARLALLNSGQVVVFIEKRSKWVLVVFSDEQRGFQGYGWVRSKYLESVGW